MDSAMPLTHSLEDLLVADSFLTDETDTNPQNDRFDEFLSSDEFLKAVDRAIEQTTPPTSHGKKNRPFTKTLPSKIKRSRQPKPKRPVSSYNLFFKQERPKVMKEFPNASFGNIARIVGQRWSRLDTATKSKLDNLYQQDLLRYRRELLAASCQTQIEEEGSLKSREDTGLPPRPHPHPIPPSPTVNRTPTSTDTVVIDPNWADNTMPVPLAPTPPYTRQPEDQCLLLKQNSIVKWENQVYRVNFRAFRMKEWKAKRFLATYCDQKNQVSVGQILSMGQPPGQPLTHELLEKG